MKRYTVTSKETSKVESNRKRQEKYRQRSLKDPDGLLLTRVQVNLSSQADGSLCRMVEATGKTKRQIIEEAIIALEKSVIL